LIPPARHAIRLGADLAAGGNVNLLPHEGNVLISGSQPDNPYAGHSNSAQRQVQTQQPSANNCRQGGPSWQLEDGACPTLANRMSTAMPRRMATMTRRARTPSAAVLGDRAHQSVGHDAPPVGMARCGKWRPAVPTVGRCALSAGLAKLPQQL
jgi:hypothetical protein